MAAGRVTSRKLLAGSARALLVFGGIAPFVPGWIDGTPVLGAFGRALDAWFAFQCYRDSARSLAASAVCTRCLGIYVGLAAGALVLRPRLESKRHLAWMLAAAATLLLDVVSETLGWRPSSAPLRFVTGFLLAYPAAVVVVRTLESVGPRRAEATNE